MRIVFGIMYFFIVLGFILTVCNAVSNTRVKEERQVDILVSLVLFAIFVVLLRVTGV